MTRARIRWIPDARSYGMRKGNTELNSHLRETCNDRGRPALRGNDMVWTNAEALERSEMCRRPSPRRVAQVTAVYDSVLLERALPNLVHLQWAQKRPLPRNAGKSVEFRRFNSLPEATVALTEGTPSNQMNVNVSNVVASISQYGSLRSLRALVA